MQPVNTFQPKNPLKKPPEELIGQHSSVQDGVPGRPPLPLVAQTPAHFLQPPGCPRHVDWYPSSWIENLGAAVSRCTAVYCPGGRPSPLDVRHDGSLVAAATHPIRSGLTEFPPKGKKRKLVWTSCRAVNWLESPPKSRDGKEPGNPTCCVEIRPRQSGETDLRGAAPLGRQGGALYQHRQSCVGRRNLRTRYSLATAWAGKIRRSSLNKTNQRTDQNRQGSFPPRSCRTMHR